MDSLQICCLTGEGTIGLASGNQLTFTGVTGTTSAFKGKITGSGDLVHKGPAGQTSYFNPQKASKFNRVRVDQGRLSIGWQAEAGFTCENIVVAKGTGFWLGDSANANVAVTCKTFTTSGDVDIGACHPSAQGELVVNGDLTQQGGDFSVGCSGSNANPGRGTVRAQNIHLISGSFRVANCTANSSARVYATNMTVDSSFTQVYVGYGETGRNAGFEIKHILTNNCANFDVNCAEGLTVAGLSGSGVFKMYYGSVVTVTNGLDQVFQGQLKQSGGAGCQFVKEGVGVQVLTGTSTYSGGTTIEAGWLCGKIGWGGSLKIGKGGAYLLAARGPTEAEIERAKGGNGTPITTSSNNLTTSLSGELSGEGVLDLAGGQLNLLRTSSFDGLITNSNTDLEKTILFIENGVDFVAGDQPHTACGKIQFSSGKSWTYLEGKFPNCVLSGSDYDVLYARNIDCECRGFVDKVDFAFGKNIIITYGFELDDFTHKGRAWSNADQGSDLKGGLIKRGAGRQIIYGGNGYTFNTGETRVEGGVLAGVIPSRAPLFVDAGAMYQVSCYDGSGKNATGVTTQTVTALRGEGTVVLATVEKAADELTVNLAGHAIETFEGTISGEGSVTIQGQGEQIFNGQLNNTTICARGGTTTFESLVQGPQQVNVEGGTLNITGGLIGGTLHLKSASSLIQISSGAHVNTTLQTEADNSTLQALSSVAIVTDCHIDHALNVMTPDNVAFALNGRLSGSGSLLKQGEGILFLMR